MEAAEGWGVDVAKHLFNSKQVNINLCLLQDKLNKWYLSFKKYRTEKWERIKIVCLLFLNTVVQNEEICMTLYKAEDLYQEVILKPREMDVMMANKNGM